MQPSSTSDRVSCTILQQRFNDIDQLAEQLQLLEKMQLTQLSTDCLQCDISLVTFDEAVFFFSQSSCPILNIGEKRKNLIGFTVVLDTDGPCIISHKRRLSHDFLFGFDPNLEVNFTLPANLKLAAVLIKRDVLQDYLKVAERFDLDDRFWASNYIHTPATLAPVKAYLSQVYHLILHQPNLLQQSCLKKLLLEDFIPLLIDSIPPVTKGVLQPPSFLTRAQLVKQAEDYMMTHLDQPLTLKDLCEALHVSRRPLFYGFQEVFGVSPMEYLKIQRLQSVRRSLKAADPSTSSVTEIARQFGFWSAGHFSRDYKMMFGELPSETLQR